MLKKDQETNNRDKKHNILPQKQIAGPGNAKAARSKVFEGSQCTRSGLRSQPIFYAVSSVLVSHLHNMEQYEEICSLLRPLCCHN